MLQNIREVISGWVAYIFVGVIAVLFGVWGIQNFFTGGQEVVVAKVGDQEITQREYEAAVRNYQTRMRQQFGDAIDERLINNPGVRRGVLQSLIDERVVGQASGELGFAVTGRQLQRAIADIPAFQVNGQFDRDLYVRTLRASPERFTPQRFEREMQSGLRADALRGVAAQTPLAARDSAERLVALRDQKRSFDYHIVEADPLRDEVEVSDEEIQAYYDSNIDQFMAPARMTVNYIEVNTQEMAGDISVPEGQLRNRFEQQENRFRNPETREASHILIEVPQEAAEDEVAAARKQAQEIAGRATPENFAELASEESEDTGSASAGGDLGVIEPGVMVEAFEEALFALDEGEISKPVRSQYGFHIIYNRKITPESGQSFEEARGQILAEEQAREADRRYLDLQEQLRLLGYENDGDLGPVAEKLGLQVRAAGPFTRSNGEGIASNEAVTDAAFSERVRTGGTSDVINLTNGRSILMRGTDFVESAPRELAEVADEIRARLQTEKAAALAEQRAEQMLAELRKGASLATLGEVVSVTASGRNNAEQPRALMQGVFAMPSPDEGDTRFGVVPAGSNNQAVVVLREVSEGDLDALSGAQLADLQAQLADSLAQAETQALVEYLRSRSDVEIYLDEDAEMTQP